MPYSTISDLPEQTNVLPSKAKEIWMEAYNSAFAEYEDEEDAIKVAWDAVKEEYKETEDGEWIKKNLEEKEKRYIVKSSDEMLNYTLGVVYAPEDIDLQDDFTDEKELRKAAWDYMVKLQKPDEVTKVAKKLLGDILTVVKQDSDSEIRVDVTKLLNSEESIEKQLGDMHAEWDDSLGDIVECYLAPCDFTLNEEEVKKGTWMLGVQWSDEMFEKVLNGERTGYSMGGTAESIEI